MYLDRYWEMFNEINGNFDNVAIRTFKVGLPTEHDLRKSLIKKPVRSVCQLMDCSSWTILISIKWSRRTSNRERGKLK